VHWNKYSEDQGAAFLAAQEPESERNLDPEEEDFENQETPISPFTASGNSKEGWQSALAEIKRCRVDLKAARKSGNQESVDRCEKALQEALENKKESILARRAERQNGRRDEAFERKPDRFAERRNEGLERKQERLAARDKMRNEAFERKQQRMVARTPEQGWRQMKK
jgi:hypothetical protein